MNPGSTSPEATLWQLVGRYIGALDGRLQQRGKSLHADQIIGIWQTVMLCHHLGQVRVFPGGFVAWHRIELEHIDLLFGGNLDAVLALSIRELTTGPVCYVAEVLAEKPGEAYKAMRELRQLPGLTHWAGWRNTDRRKVAKIHGR